jgi:hypothetical protein
MKNETRFYRKEHALHSFMAAFSQEQATLPHGLYSRSALIGTGHRLVIAGCRQRTQRKECKILAIQA